MGALAGTSLLNAQTEGGGTYLAADLQQMPPDVRSDFIARLRQFGENLDPEGMDVTLLGEKLGEVAKPFLERHFSFN